MKVNPISMPRYSGFSVTNSTRIEQPAKFSRNKNNGMSELPNCRYNSVMFQGNLTPSEINKIIAKAPLGDKIGTALKKLTEDDLLVVSSSVEKAKKALEPIFKDYLCMPVHKLYFMKAPELKENLLFGKTSHSESVFWNIENNPIFIDIMDINPNCLVKLHKDSIMTLSNKQIVFNKYIKNREILEKYTDSFIQEFNYSEDITKYAERHNIKILEDMLQKSKYPSIQKKAISFDEVGGQQEAIESIKRNVIYPLKYPEVFANMTTNRGVLLSGPPGCGKTLLAEVAGRESGASVFKVSASELDSKFVGESEANWRKLVAQAVDAQPSIIFIDEIDAIAKKRGGHDVYGDKVLNQILALMSDVEKKGNNVYFIASTNRPDTLDSAVMRSGRFGLHVKMKAPDLKGVGEIFDIHAKNKPLTENLSKDKIIKTMHAKNMSGADIAVAVSDAYKNAMEREGIYESMGNGTFHPQMMDYLRITEEDFIKAINDFDSKCHERRPIGFTTIK